MSGTEREAAAMRTAERGEPTRSARLQRAARRSREAGFAYLLVIALLLVASIGIVALGHTVGTVSADARRDAAALRARLAAEAAVEAARAALRQDQSYEGEVVTLGAARGTVRVATEPGAPLRRRLVATGRAPLQNRQRDEVTRKVEADVVLRPGRLPRVVGWRER